MHTRFNFSLVAPSIVVWFVAGTFMVQGAPVTLDDFEGYGVADNTYLDPTTVPGSGWSRTDAGAGPDWEVACCSGGGNALPPDYTFDGSDAHLRLRRDDPGGDPGSVQITELTIADMLDGSISFEVNPSARSGGHAFEAELFDSVTQLPLAKVRYRVFVNNFLAGWEVFAFTRGAPIATTQNPIGAFTDTLDRWFKVTITTLSNSNFNVVIEDIGPTMPVFVSAPFGEGVIVDASWTNGTPVPVVDRFRLTEGSGNGASNDTKPTMIDNITQDIFIAVAPVPVAGVELGGAVKISFPTEAGREYQPEFSDELSLDTWEVLGPVIDGDGTTQCVFDATAGVSDRAFRVLDLDPKPPIPIVEDFEYFSVVGPSNFVDITTLSTNWTAFLPGTSDSGTNGPDWEVICCGNDVDDHTGEPFDGSDRQLVQRRENTTGPPFASELDTDFDLAAVTGGPISNGTIEVQMNPSDVGGSTPGVSGSFHLAYYDSISSNNALRVVFREIQSNAGDFEIWSSTDQLLATGNALNGNAFAFGRWFSISFTIRLPGKMDIICTDIGPTIPNIRSSDPARGPVLTLLNLDLPDGLTSVDTFRLTTGSMNGGNTDFTTIDNIAAGPFLRRTGDEIGGLEEPVQATEITYPTEQGNFYQPEYSDDGGTTWFDLDPQVESFAGFTLSAFDLVAPGRTYRVLDLRPNHKPVANAGPDQTVAVLDTVTLDGSGSFDPDADTLSFAWTLISVPAGSSATPSNSSAVVTSFDADLAGTYEAELIVNDGVVASDPDTVTITAQ